MKEFRVCQVDELTDPGSLELTSPCEGMEANIFLVRMAGHIHAYVNSCPHTGVPLNWLPDQFLDYSGALIQCALHGAQFRPGDGYCIWGPCQGQSLKSLPVRIHRQQVYVTCA